MMVQPWATQEGLAQATWPNSRRVKVGLAGVWYFLGFLHGSLCFVALLNLGEC